MRTSFLDKKFVAEKKILHRAVLVWILILLAHLDEVQEELLYYPRIGVGVGVSKMLKFLRLGLSCDGQGVVRRAILSL